MKRKSIVICLVLVIAMMCSAPVSAATKLPYKDVNKKTVDTKSIKAISYVKSHGGYIGVIKGKKFHPRKKITKRQYIAILANMYGQNNVPTDISDVLGANKRIDAKWATTKLSQVADRRANLTITWSNLPKGKLTRADAARYIKIFAEYDEALRPIK